VPKQEPKDRKLSLFWGWPSFHVRVTRLASQVATSVASTAKRRWEVIMPANLNVDPRPRPHRARA